MSASEDQSEVVGPIVGPISAGVIAQQGATFVGRGAQYDIYIDGLPFVKAPSDERPYARQTADFKKTQIDQGNTVGDQSLTGYWTRGQLSFHRGSGINFYEVLEGESVLNRFTDSEGIDPWTPGAVTVKASTSSVSAVSASDALPHDGGIATRSSGGVVRLLTYAGSPTSLPSSDGNPFSSFCTDGTNLYATNDNKIEKRAPGGSFAVLWTHGTGGRSWRYVWWAKNRLWAIDNTGELYTLPVAGGTGTTAAGDVLWTSNLSSTVWALADSEGGVFIASGSTIYLSTIDASTATPVLGSPVSVATVGAQEVVSTLGSYLGYLIVGSGSGVRMGRIQQGGVLLGDLIFRANISACSRFAYRESLVLITGTIGNSTRLYELNVLEQTSDISGAYAPVRTIGTGVSVHGALVLPDGRSGTFSSSGISLEATAVSNSVGYVQTAFHRFGTLEPKDFRSVTVRAQGTAGTIAVSLVTRDGATRSLVTLGAANFYDNEISLNVDGVTDYIGLRFTITAEGGVAPTFLGYQLRALPAPIRQRLIQVPLLCFDMEKIGNVDYGHKGWSWDRLFALEDMEATSGVVQYRDLNSGETATVSIESVQFQNRTPTRVDGNGSGGWIVLTLRKVA